MFAVLLISSISVLAQADALVFIGGDVMRGKEKMRGDIEQFEVRLMFGAPELRLGPFFNGTWSYSYTTDNAPLGYYYRARDLTLGLSLDSRKKGDYSYRYFWVNGGIRFSEDNGWNSLYQASQQNPIFYLSGGLNFCSFYQNWFGSNSVFVEAQEPIGKGSFDVEYNADTLQNTNPFNKERLRIVGEAGIKQIAFFLGMRYLALDPFIHLGYGWETGTRKQLAEIGGGIGFGYIDSDDRYNECFKLKLYNRQDLNYQRGAQTAFPSAWIAEVTASIKITMKK